MRTNFKTSSSNFPTTYILVGSVCTVGPLMSEKPSTRAQLRKPSAQCALELVVPRQKCWEFITCLEMLWLALKILHVLACRDWHMDAFAASCVLAAPQQSENQNKLDFVLHAMWQVFGRPWPWRPQLFTTNSKVFPQFYFQLRLAAAGPLPSCKLNGIM